MAFVLKRVYDAADAADGFRVLVDRIWPRGLSKQKVALDEWARDVAPSNELRKWFGHVDERYEEFRERYRVELDANDAVTALRTLGTQHDTVTLLYSAHDTAHNQAVVLREYLTES
jgi:uncharacterized protein YeaO (DUF488 family)